jgi:hypothetical protein
VTGSSPITGVLLMLLLSVVFGFVMGIGTGKRWWFLGGFDGLDTSLVRYSALL